MASLPASGSWSRSDETHDLVIAGGGTAGLVAAFGAAGVGARVALVERGRLVGATVAAPAGGEAIAELTARLGAKIAGISQAVHAYPTFAEGPARAADEHLRARFLSARVRRISRPVLSGLRLVERRR